MESPIISNAKVFDIIKTLNEEDKMLCNMMCSGMILKCSFCNVSKPDDVGIYLSSFMKHDEVSSCSNYMCTNLRRRAISLKQIRNISIGVEQLQNIRVRRSSGEKQCGFIPVEIGYSTGELRYIILVSSADIKKIMYLDECASINKYIIIYLKYNPFIDQYMIDDLNRCIGREFIRMRPE
jgi:hypothetical protein